MENVKLKIGGNIYQNVASLNPAHMPIIPPNILSSIEDIDKYPAPHREGIKLPIVDPMNSPRYMRGFAFMNIFYTD